MFRRVPAVVSTIKRKKMTELTKDTKHNRQDESTRPSLHRCKFTDRYLRFSRRFPLLGISRFLIAVNNRKKTYHKAIKQSQTVNELGPNQLFRHDVPTATDQGTPKSGLRSPKVTHFQALVSRGGAGKDTERKDRILEPDTLPNISCLMCFKTFNFCSANKLMFKAARVQKRLGVGVWGHIYPGWQKGRYAKFFTFVFLSRWRSLRTKKIAPIILHLKTIQF